MLEVNGLKKVLMGAISEGVFPENGVALSGAIISYVKANGTPTPPTISYTLGPASGASWASLIPLASEKGVADYIISNVLVVEFGGSTKVIPSPSGVSTVGMTFNTGAKVEDMSSCTTPDEVWEKISKAIIEFFEPEIK